MPSNRPSPGSEAMADRSAGFSATHWSVVLAAGQEDSPQRRAALECLCRGYWVPICNYIRHRGYDVADAQDLTQAFFVHLLTSPLLRSAHPQMGKFRCFLAVSLKHFLINEAQRNQATKRGGKESFVPLDETRAETLHLQDGEPGESAEIRFDREWALTVMQHAFERLRDEWTRRGKADQFEQLKVFLSCEGSASDYAVVGEKLRMQTKSVPVTLHRLRRTYGDLVRDEIAQTVSTRAEVEEEIRYLLKLVGGNCTVIADEVFCKTQAET